MKSSQGKESSNCGEWEVPVWECVVGIRGRNPVELSLVVFK